MGDALKESYSKGITMISKLDRLLGRDIYENTALAKINELVDAVNNLQTANTHIQNDLLETLHKCPTAISNDYTVIKYSELCRLQKAADELARLKGLTGVKN